MNSLSAVPDLVVERPEGLYCPAGDFFIDPWRAVPRAVITHAHADHARAGHGHVLATAVSEGVLRARLGARLPLQGLAYGEAVTHGGVRISLHPAGHVLGSAQVRLERGGQVWVASGDYYLTAHDEHNPTCPPFEPVRCHCFITESTFGLPVYRWAPQAEVMAQVNQWWQANAAQGRASLLLGYSFGKAQRLLAGVDAGIGPCFVHAAMDPINQAYRAAGVPLPPAPVLPEQPDTATRAVLARALVLAPPTVLGSAWVQRLGPFSAAFASGWMALRHTRRRRGMDQGFVLSDHADWPGLQRAIRATGAERVIVTHGFEAPMVRWLGEQGVASGTIHTEYGSDASAPSEALGAAPADDADVGAAADVGADAAG